MWPAKPANSNGGPWIYVTDTESGIRNSEDGSCIIERNQGGNDSRWTGKSVGFDCTHAKLSHRIRGSRQLWYHLMMSLLFCLCWRKGVYKGACMNLCGSLGEFAGHLVISEGHVLPFSSRSPLTPYLSYLSALWGVGLSQTGKCYLFISSVAYTQG